MTSSNGAQWVKARAVRASPRPETFDLVYLCYIHRQAGGAPHFEVLPETSQSGAMTHAARMMAQRADAIRAEVWEGDRLVFSLPRSAAPDPPAAI